ncbi:MAG: hypothetical protein M0Q92_10900 [Methanoregula sp.]|nr:hypothetical protein [Methanoregula sp.]
MARLNDDAQWIVLMGFIISFSLFFIAIILNQSTVVGQTTAEAVSEFPKNDIRGVRDMIIQSADLEDQGSYLNKTNVQNEIRQLSLERHGSVVQFSTQSESWSGVPTKLVEIHYYNGVMSYNETWRS